MPQRKRFRFAVKNVSNLEETTGPFSRRIPSKSVCKNSYPGHKNFKDRISLVLTANIDGSEKLTTLLIRKSKRPRCFKNFSHENYVDYKANSRARMASEIFSNWLLEWENKLEKKNFIDL